LRKEGCWVDIEGTCLFFKWPLTGKKERKMSEDMSKKMMNLTLHVQRQSEVDLVYEKTGLDLERSPQGVFVSNGEEGLQRAADEVIAKLGIYKYEHILVGGSTGLVAKIVKYITEKGLDIALYEFENSKNRDPQTNKVKFNPINIRRMV